MNPWSGAEPGSEARDRELFARRARALGPARIPPLAAVLQAARGAEPARAVHAVHPSGAGAADDGRERRAARGAQGRAFMALALAAACMAAAVTKLPSTGSPASIAAELDAAAPGVASASAAVFSAACELDDEVLMSEERACVAPTPLFSAAPKMTLLSSAPPPPLACIAHESCSLSATP